MPAFSQYLQDKVVKHLFNDVSWTPPSTIYIAAFTTMPTETGGGTEAVGYTRIRVDNVMTFGATGSGVYSNPATVSFTDLPDGTYVGVATYDASTAGNMLTFGQLDPPKTTTDGTLAFPAGNLIIGAN
jgi:hypothetical protein